MSSKCFWFPYHRELISKAAKVIPAVNGMIIKFVSVRYYSKAYLYKNTSYTSLSYICAFMTISFIELSSNIGTQPIGNTKMHEYKRIAKGVRLTGVQMVIKLSRDSYEYN